MGAGVAGGGKTARRVAGFAGVPRPGAVAVRRPADASGQTAAGDG
ncbi:hypothetical protein [Streptomyces nogalater]